MHLLVVLRELFQFTSCRVCSTYMSICLSVRIKRNSFPSECVFIRFGVKIFENVLIKFKIH